MAVDGRRSTRQRRRGGGVVLGGPRVSVEMPIALLFLDPLPWAYEAALMASIALIGSTLLSLGRGCSSRHTTVLTPEPSEGQRRSSFEKHRLGWRGEIEEGI